MIYLLYTVYHFLHHYAPRRNEVADQSTVIEELEKQKEELLKTIQVHQPRFHIKSSRDAPDTV
jgi:hypothetical protein